MHATSGQGVSSGDSCTRPLFPAPGQIANMRKLCKASTLRFEAGTPAVKGRSEGPPLDLKPRERVWHPLCHVTPHYVTPAKERVANCRTSFCSHLQQQKVLELVGQHTVLQMYTNMYADQKCTLFSGACPTAEGRRCTESASRDDRRRRQGSAN